MLLEDKTAQIKGFNIYPSANKTPAEVNESYFDSYTLDMSVEFPNEEGSYYVAIETISDNNVKREVLYGPFLIEQPEPPKIEISYNNYIIPSGNTRIEFDFVLPKHSKDVELEIDISELVEEKIDLRLLMQYTFKSLSLKNSIGSTLKISDKERNVNMTYKVNDDKILINCKELESGRYTVILNMATQLMPTIPYQQYVNEYINQSKAGSVGMTIKATPVLNINEGTTGSEIRDEKRMMIRYNRIPQIG